MNKKIRKTINEAINESYNWQNQAYPQVNVPELGDLMLAEVYENGAIQVQDIECADEEPDTLNSRVVQPTDKNYDALLKATYEFALQWFAEVDEREQLIRIKWINLIATDEDDILRARDDESAAILIQLIGTTRFHLDKYNEVCRIAGEHGYGLDVDEPEEPLPAYIK